MCLCFFNIGACMIIVGPASKAIGYGFPPQPEVFFASAILSNSLLIGVQVHYAAQSMGSPLPPAFFIVEQMLVFQVLSYSCCIGPVVLKYGSHGSWWSCLFYGLVMNSYVLFFRFLLSFWLPVISFLPPHARALQSLCPAFPRGADLASLGRGLAIFLVVAKYGLELLGVSARILVDVFT